MLQEWAAQVSRWWNEPNVYDSMVAVYTALPAIVTPTLFAIDAPYGKTKQDVRKAYIAI